MAFLTGFEETDLTPYASATSVLSSPTPHTATPPSYMCASCSKCFNTIEAAYGKFDLLNLKYRPGEAIPNFERLSVYIFTSRFTMTD